VTHDQLATQAPAGSKAGFRRGFVGPVLFVLTFTVAGLLRASYSPVDQAVSDLGVGDHGWMLNRCLVILGLSLVGFAIGFYQTIRPPASTAFRFMTSSPRRPLQLR